MDVVLTTVRSGFLLSRVPAKVDARASRPGPLPCRARDHADDAGERSRRHSRGGLDDAGHQVGLVLPVLELPCLDVEAQLVDDGLGVEVA